MKLLFKCVLTNMLFVLKELAARFNRLRRLRGVLR